MLQQSKTTLFNDTHKVKMENPEMPVEQWMAYIDERRCSYRVEKVVSGKKALGGKRYGYKISTVDPLWPNIVPPVRSRADFHLLYLQLVKRFPNAVVPKISKNEVDNLHLMEMYLTELSLNPFFRMDVAFSDFLNGKCIEYKQNKKNDRKHSQGTLRWLQMTTEYREFETSTELLKIVKHDLDHLERANRSLENTLKTQIEALVQLQSAAHRFTEGLGEFLAVEQTSENQIGGSVSGLPVGRLGGRLKELIDLNQGHLRGLKQAHDGGSLERLTIHHLKIERKMVAGLKKLLHDVLEKAKNDFEKAKTAFDGIPNEDPDKRKKEEALALKELIYFKQRRAFGYELERFRTYRTLKFNTFLNNVVRFNMRGARRMNEEWSKSGLTLDPSEEAEFYKMDQIYNDQAENHLGRNRAMSVNQSTKMRSKMLPTGSEFESLKVITSYTPSLMGSKYMKVIEGELLTGVKLPNGDWQVHNSKGGRGIVKGSNVVVHTGNNSKSFNNMSGYNYNNNDYEVSARDRGDSDWTLSDDGKMKANDNGHSFGNFNSPINAPVAPSKPAAPPGLPAFVIANPGNPGGIPKPPTSKPIDMNSAPPPPNSKPVGGSPPGGFAFPKPPGGGDAFNAPSGGPPGGMFNGGPKPPSGGPMGIPGPPPGGPPSGMGVPKPPGGPGNFGAPSPPGGPGSFGGPRPPGGPGAFGGPGPKPPGGPGAFGAPSGGPKPPSGGPKPPSGGPKPPSSAPASKRATKQNGKKKPKFGGGKPGKNPFGGGGGAGGFLADIQKGNNLKKLKKVPDSEKSKEIGGEKGKGPPGAVVGPGGPTGNVPAPQPSGGFSGGGGGMFGELQAKLNKRR